MTDRLITILLLATLAATPLYVVRFAIGPIPTNLLEVLIIATVVAVAGIALRKHLPPRMTPVRYSTLLAAVLIAGGALLATALGGDWRTGLGITKSWFVLPILLAAATVHAVDISLVSRRAVMYTLIASATAVAITSLGYAAADIFTYDHRLAAFYLSPNHLAMTLAPVLPLITGLLVGTRSRTTRVLLVGAALTVGVTLYLTRSFGGMLSGGAGVIIALTCLSSDRRTLLRGIVMAGASLLVALLLLWHTPRMQDFFTMPERSSISSRLTIYTVALRILGDHPWTGIGPGGFQDAYLAYQPSYPPYLEWAVPQPHNLYLAFWLQTGLMGMVGFLLLLITLLRIVRRHPDPLTLTAAAALATILLHGLVDTPYWKNDLAVVFWVIVALIACAGPHRLTSSERL